MVRVICPNCNKEFFSGSVCPRCGNAVRAVCPQCGSPAEGNFCSRCGARIPAAVPELDSDKNKWAAFFLCLFLGALGIHRFYTGKIGTGILWLLLFAVTSKLWTVAVLVDLILIVMGKFKDKQGRYLR